jgi:site-specific DNA-methyltransferase (adenine-specific)/modification methylase
MEINKIYCESNLETMAKMPNNFLDLVLTSPPYNIFNTKAKDRGYDYYEDNKTDIEYVEWTLNIFNEFNRVLKKDSIVIYNMGYGTENPNLMNITISSIIQNTNFSLADIIVWKKNTAMPNSPSKNRLTRICEFVYIFCRKEELYSFNANKKILNESNGAKFYESIDNFINAKNNDESNDLNKATFSTEFVRKLFKIYAKENSLVYDPFMGTGTTAKACIIDKHNFIGSELSKSQVDYANKRLQPYLDQQTLF